MQFSSYEQQQLMMNSDHQLLPIFTIFLKFVFTYVWPIGVERNWKDMQVELRGLPSTL